MRENLRLAFDWGAETTDFTECRVGGAVFSFEALRKDLNLELLSIKDNAYDFSEYDGSKGTGPQMGEMSTKPGSGRNIAHGIVVSSGATPRGLPLNFLICRSVRQ
jgi:hypothetical protein